MALLGVLFAAGAAATPAELRADGDACGTTAGGTTLDAHVLDAQVLDGHVLDAHAVEQAAHRTVADTYGTGVGARSPRVVDPARPDTPVAKLRRVALPLVRQAIELRPETSRWHWRLKLFPGPGLSALAHEGGEIVIHAGLVDRLHPTDDELAQVIAHEVARMLARVDNEPLSSRRRASLRLAPDGLLARASGVGAALHVAQLAAPLQVTGTDSPPVPEVGLRPDAETIAERVGLLLAARAGFDPRAAVTVLQKVRRLPDADRWATRGVDEARLRQIRRILPEVLEVYRARQGTRIAGAGAPGV